MRPLKRCEEAQAPSRGKRSHLRKGTAAVNQSIIVFNRSFSFSALHVGEHVSFAGLEGVFETVGYRFAS